MSMSSARPASRRDCPRMALTQSGLSQLPGLTVPRVVESRTSVRQVNVAAGPSRPPTPSGGVLLLRLPRQCALEIANPFCCIKKVEALKDGGAVNRDLVRISWGAITRLVRMLQLVPQIFDQASPLEVAVS